MASRAPNRSALNTEPHVFAFIPPAPTHDWGESRDISHVELDLRLHGSGALGFCIAGHVLVPRPTWVLLCQLGYTP